MKLAVLSDIHGHLVDNIRPVDVVIFCGDIIPLFCQRDVDMSREWFTCEFIPYASKLPAKHVIFIGGNHDFYLETLVSQRISEKIWYLNNTCVTLDDVTFYGCPMTSKLRNWAFYDATYNYDDMPRADVLICHDMPNVVNAHYVYGKTFGNDNLTRQLHKYKYCFCGHWHDANHEQLIHDDCKIFNTSIKNDNYEIAYDVKYVEI